MWTQRTMSSRVKFGLVCLERTRSASERRLRRVRLERGFVDTSRTMSSRAEFGLVRLERTNKERMRRRPVRKLIVDVIKW